MSLSQRLREGTRDEHARAERSGIVARLLAAELEASGYCLLLRNLHPLYEALEEALPSCQEVPGVAPFLEPALARRASLAQDLATLHGAGWERELPLAPAARAYVDHLAELARQGSMLLIAHAYVRYFGDLNGGRVLRTLVARAYQLDARAGLAFYDFGRDGPGLLERLKDGLAAFQPGEVDAAALVLEAKGAYQRHIALFEELEGLLEDGGPTRSPRQTS